MNHFCVRFIKLSFSDLSAVYGVESFDFSEYDCWEEVAQLRVNLLERDYLFEPGERWQRERILPPKFYALSEEAQAAEFREVWAPLRMGLGAYAMRVHDFVLHCLEEKSLPDRYPALLFPEATAVPAAPGDASAGVRGMKRRGVPPPFGQDCNPASKTGVLRAFTECIDGPR